ncbi:uncharacterized protein [Sinocyclocheilus grahami]|uniref:uncharacterized protein n=1 Tax=Sinocyclocheilus grahami TaxID=75366 RepID=UPI0007AD570E|nr:PREDICTED: uncharacterized protein LOC107559181 [Sinocyclocheilus grahami]
MEQSFMGEKARSEEAPSPALSHLSMKSDQSMDRPIAFNNETPSYISLRPDKAPSPATSNFSLKSNNLMDRPIAFKDRTQPYSVKCLRQDKAPSPAPSLLSVKSDQSMDRPVAFNNENPSYIGYENCRPDEAPSPATSYFSLKSNQSMDRPIAFKDGTQPYSVKRLRPNETPSPAPSLLSIKSDQSMDRPIAFIKGTPSYTGYENLRPDEAPSPATSYFSLKSNNSMDRPIAFKDRTQPYSVKNLRPDESPSPALSFLSVKSEQSMDRPIAFRDEAQSYRLRSKDTKEIKELDVAFIDEISRDEKIEYSHPTKCFYSGFSTNDLPMDVTEVAALGRPLDLGMLYDQRNESFISDSNLWDNHTLTSDRISWPQLKTLLKVLEDDSLQERCRAFEMSPMLRVRALCGLMELNGAAAFLNHPVQSQHQDRVTVHYKTTTRLDMISQRLLQEGAPASVINAATATHVIIAVFYGAQAFFVFDNERISSEKNSEMENVIKKMTTTLSARDVFSSLHENEKANTILYDCSLYTDLGDWKSPVSFDKALEIYGSLPTLLGSKDERAVPLKVWLYPLKKLDKSSVHVALSGVSETLMHQAENILEHLRKQIGMCQDMITDYDNLTVITWFPALTEKLQNFSEFLQDYRTEFQRKTAKIIESKHINEEEREKSLQELISNCDQSPFSLENTQHWLEKKETELVVLNGCRAANMTIVKSQEELQRVINDPLMSSVFCFTSSMEAEDSFLTVLKQHIELMKKSTLIISKRINLEDSLQPLKPVCISEKVLSDLKVFIGAKETNEDPKQTRFIAASVPDDGYSEFSVQFYHEGRIVSRNLNLQRKTDLAQISQIKHNSVSLKINKKQNRNIERYVIQYRALGDGMNNTTWKQIIFDSKSVKETCVISDLKSGKQYQLRYSVIEQDCMSNFSRIINIKTAFSPINGQPFVNKLNRDTLRLAWLKAETGEDCPVLRYMVEYKEAGLEGWSSVQTQGPECECTLTLPHNTCYRVRVSAVYGGDTSKPSEETPVPVDVWSINLSERKSSILLEVLKLQTEKKPVELIDWTDEESEVKGFLQCLPYISELRFAVPHNKTAGSWDKRKRFFILDLCLQAALNQKETIEENVKKLLSSVDYEKCDFLLDLCSHVKDYETQTAVLLYTDEESEVKGFLQCLPYISQLRFAVPHNKTAGSWDKRKRFFILDLCLQAALHQKETIEETVKKLLSSVDYKKCDFLLDLYSHMKDYETQTGRSVLPALQPIYQSAPAVWIIKLSERKSSILLEVLKLQTEKKPVELIDWTDEESEVKGFLQCLPYISQLRFHSIVGNEKNMSVKFLVNLIVSASEFKTTGENYTELFTSVCSYTSFPFSENYTNRHAAQCDFLLDLCSHVKNYETQTDRSVLPALQPIYQSAPAVWRIKLSERKSSILLEVLKLQTEKKPVELRDCTDEESEVKGFLQCLPYISQLRFYPYEKKRSFQFLLNLIISASEFHKTTGENYTELLTSVCSYTFFPFNEDYLDDFESQIDQCDFLLDLCSHVKDYETQTGRSVLPALQPIYQSAPAVWRINLSERKSSILLEVLKLQTEKKPVELRDWTDEESEVKGFLQCLPYISQLRISEWFISSLCKVFGPRVKADQVAPLLKALDFTVTLSEKLPSSTCRSVGEFRASKNSKQNPFHFLSILTLPSLLSVQ